MRSNEALLGGTVILGPPDEFHLGFLLEDRARNDMILLIHGRVSEGFSARVGSTLVHPVVGYVLLFKVLCT